MTSAPAPSAKGFTPYSLHPDGKGIWCRFLAEDDRSRVMATVGDTSCDFVLVEVLRQRGGPYAVRPVPPRLCAALQALNVRTVPWAMCAPGGAKDAAAQLIRGARDTGELWVAVDGEEYDERYDDAPDDSAELVDRLHAAGLFVIYTSWGEPWKLWPKTRGYLEADAGWPQLAELRWNHAQKIIASWQDAFPGKPISPVLQPYIASKLPTRPTTLAELCAGVPRPSGSVSVWDEGRLSARPGERAALRALEIPGRS